MNDHGSAPDRDEQGLPHAARALQDALAAQYTLVRELGRGGMATVYLARDVKHDRPVALKVLHPDLGAALGPERFRREITIAARLQHPHIVGVLDSGETHTGPAEAWLWFTMPYIDGESLRDRLARDGQLPVRDAVRIAREAALALDFAHRHGIIHRDIKPENILLADGQALVADFGIAHALQEGGERSGHSVTRLTGTGLSIGTPAYMSPEQSAAERTVDARTDVYALGAVLFEMLAGEPPFTGPTPQVIIAKRLSAPAPSVRVARPSVSAALEAVIARALATAPADRFQSAAEFADALEAATTGTAPAVEGTGATASGADTSGAPAVPMSRRMRRRTFAWFVVAAVVVGGGALTLWWRSRAGAASAVSAGTTRLAVLPFDNLGRPQDAYVVDGITDEIRDKLSSVPGIHVIARASSNQYRGDTKPPQQIASELGVQYLLTGTVRSEPGPAGHPARVRVAPELVQVTANSTPENRWAETFDAQVQDVFVMQADIASRVASAMNVALGSATQAKLAEAPTRNPAAYDAYLRAEAATGGFASGEPAALRHALVYYRQAVELDPSFAVAWAGRAQAAAQLYKNGVPTQALADEARSAVEQARALAPDAPATARALGDYYTTVARDNSKALVVLARTRQLAPDNAELLSVAGNLDRLLGRWSAAVQDLGAAAQLDPRSAATVRRLAEALLWTRQYPAARQAADRLLALTPPAASATAVEDRAMVELATGDLAAARRVVASAPAGLAPQGLDRDALLVVFGTYWDLYWVLNDADQRRLLELPVSAFDGDRGAWSIVRAETYWVRGDTAHSRVYADSARIEFEAQLRSAPDDPQRTALLGLALAYARRSAEAMHAGERAVALAPISRDGFNGPYLEHVLARIYLLSGQYDKALDALTPLLRIPYYLSPGWLRIDPTFDSLRSNPRFQQLVAGR